MGICYNNYVKINSTTFEGTKPEFVLKTVFGYDSFRPLQKEIIENVLSHKDTLAVMPTGGGKSICYQIPALIMEGITIVVSPLISLMQDQVSSLEASGIHSVFLNSTLEWKKYRETVEDIQSGNVKIVYVSPEGLATEKVREIFNNSEIKVSCLTIDEAHCVSEWGHDFRPDYMEIKNVRHYFPDAVMLGLTATATEKVRTDISKNLGLKQPSVFVSSFNRENIFLEVQLKKNGISQIIDCINRHKGDSGIIYCFSRRQVDDLTETLEKMGYSVLSYHAGLSDEIRAKNQEKFIKDQIQIMVATVAFGMGINKPNVRFVINYDLPKSIEEYYQEIGRAGRDGLPSHALLLYSFGDVNKIRFFFDEVADPTKREPLLQNMVDYSSSKICRRKTLLNYFGEKFSPKVDSKCCCDVCSKENNPLVDVTIPIQKILCCIIRTRELFGASYIIDILLGSKNKRILENGHERLSTWGIGKDLSRDDWYELLSYMLVDKYVIKTTDYSSIKVTELGREILNNRTEIKYPIVFAGPKVRANPSGKLISKERIVPEKPAVDDQVAEKLIAELKNWRKRKAEDMNVPPYIIFGDKTMYDIAAKKPKSKTELMNVYGMGNIKVENFGSALLRIINES